MTRKTKKALEEENKQLRNELEKVKRQIRELLGKLDRKTESDVVAQVCSTRRFGKVVDAVTFLPLDESAPPCAGPGHSYLKGVNDPWN